MRITLFLLALVLLNACSDEAKPAPVAPVPSVIFDDLHADEVWRLPVSGPVEVARDQYGIPHFYAATLGDLMLVQGYVVARDRFWEMDVFRRLAEGKLSTLVGNLPILHDLDVLFRSINLTDDGKLVYEQIYEEMDTRGRLLVDAYTEGVNLYLEHAATGKYGARFPPEYNELILGLLFHPTPADIPRWQPSDSIAIGRLQQWNLSGSNIEREILIAKLHAAMPATWITSLVRFRPAVTTATLTDWPGVHPGAASAPAISPLLIDGGDSLEIFRTLRENFPALLWNDNGSNNWVLGPSRTESGNVLLANDPHLIVTNPPLFYQAHFNLTEMGGAEAWNAYGVVFPGIPVFMIAHTERVAWGVTVLGYDVMDVYHETLNASGTAVKRGAAEIPIRYSEQKFCHGYSDDCIIRRIPYVPGHGPRVLGESEFFTFRWTGREPTQDFAAFEGLMTARNVDEAVDTIQAFRVGAQNFVVGDIDGNIAYTGPANVPVRPAGCTPYMVLDGAAGACEWQSYLPDDALPQAKNPAQGYIGTANNDIVGTSFDNDPLNDSHYYWSSRDAGFRMARLKQLLDEKEKYNEADMERIQADVHLVEGEHIAPYLVAAGDAASGLGITVSPAARDALEYLRKWTYKATTGVEDPFTAATPGEQAVIDSVATSIYFTWTRYLKAPFIGDEYAAHGFVPPSETDGYEPLGLARVLLHALQSPAEAGFLWDDVSTAGVTETKEAVMLGALEDAVAWLTERFGSDDLATWNWGKLHILRLFDPYGFLGANMRAIGPFPSDGALGTLDAATPLFLFGNYVQVGGPVMRMVTELGPDGVRAWNSLPGGQVHDRESPFYDNLVEYYLTNTTYRVPFQKAEVRENLAGLTIVLP
jgi:penicillin amidase